MSGINSLIKSQISKNGISGKRTNIGEILTLPYYESGSFAAPTTITVQYYEYMPTAVFIGNNNYFIMKNSNNKILLYKSDGSANNAIVTGNFKFTDASNKIVTPDLVYNATAGGILNLLNFFDSDAKVLYINGVIETLTNGETFVAGGKIYVKMGETLGAFAPA